MAVCNMAALDQNKYTQFVNLLNQNDFFSNVSINVISPLFNCICIISKQRDASLYSLPNVESEVVPFWRCPSKAQRCFFSEDGKHLLLVLSVNSFQIYTVTEENVILTMQFKASVLADLLRSYAIDFSAACKVEPLKFKRNELIIVVDSKLVICLEWGLIGVPTIRYAVPLSGHLDVHTNKQYLFILMNNGIINAYDTTTGQKCPEELNARLANRTNSDVSVGHNFTKLSAHPNSKFLAVVNQDEETVIFDISDLFSDCRNIVTTPVEAKREKWSWSGKSRKPATEGRIHTGRVIGKVAPNMGLVVSFLQFSLKGLFAFYSILGQSKCISFKVIDESTGDVLNNFEGLVESEIVVGGSLPLVMSNSILSICLGVMCNDYFIIKLCEIVPNFGFSKELERTLLSHQWSGTSECHLHFLKIILNLHANSFYSSLKAITKAKTEENATVESGILEKKIVDRLDDLFKLVLESRNDEKNEETNLRQEMLVCCFRHAVRLLDLIHQEMKKDTNTQLELSLSLLKNILKLFTHVKHLDPLRDELVTWRGMTDLEVVQEAVVVGAVALAHVFFITDRGWSVEDVQSKFNAESHSWIVELISMGDLEKGKLALTNLGCEPLDHLKTWCLDTNEPIMRDLLADYLKEAGQLSEAEVEAWQFCRKIEGALSSVIKRYHSFDHKMTVGLRDKVNIVMLKMLPYNGSIDLRTVLLYSDKWREMVLTEVYFSTGDATLEKTLKRELSWQYLLEMNQIDLLKTWIDLSFDPDCLEPLLKASDYLTKSFYTLFAGWSVTESMLDLVGSVKCMTATKNSVLDHCALYGVFPATEKHSLRDIVYRIENNSSLPIIREVLSKRTSNVKLEDFDQMVLTKCVQHDLKSVIMTCLVESKLLKDSSILKDEFPWLEVWQIFRKWDNNRTSRALMSEAICKSSHIISVDSQDIPFLAIAKALIEEKEISKIIEEDDGDNTLLQVPLVEIGWQTARGTNNRTPDVSLYDLLHCSNVPVDKLFLWQAQNMNFIQAQSNELLSEFPHFNHQVLGTKYGFKQNLDYMYYLKQGRPSFACNLFIVESLRSQRRLTTKMIRRACGLAHGLALRYWRDSAVGSACVAFITMLGDISSANTLRIHLAAVSSIFNHLSEDDRNYISTLVHGIITKDIVPLQEMATLLETAIMKSISSEKFISQLRKWALPVSFCNSHGLPLPTLLPRHLAKCRNWFAFALCLDIYKYPYEQAIEVIEDIDSKILKSHLIRALTRTTLKLSTTSPSKSPPKILLEPENSGKDDTETGSNKDNKDVFQSFVTNIYTEVLNTIQTFTDRNIVLPWSCEQDPDSDVLLTLLKCESEPDTFKSLLICSIELQSPVLAILATCFQSDNVFPNMVAWFVSSIPSSMSRIKRREEGQQIVDRCYGPKEMEILLRHFFSTGYFQTFYRGMTLFMAENPLTLFVDAVYQATVILDFTGALEVLKEFVVEMNHSRVKESTPYSKSWILKVVAQLIENLLTRPDVLNSVKRQFLRILANSEIASVDPAFPNYLLWYQICEILESSETNLDFVQLYDITMVSEELQNCLDDLLKNRQFIQALEICSLLSLNKDKLVIAMWTHQIETVMKSGGDVFPLWTESSIAFKDENVNPNMSASFYHEMSSRFATSNAASLKNKYTALDFCLHWRRCIEDTSSAPFREESDSIELEKWLCCIDPSFELSILKTAASVDVAYSLLVSIWSSSKVLVRSQILSETDTERVETIINMFLDHGDLHRALRVSAFFKSNNQDLMTITSCLKITHGEVTPSEITKFNSALITPRKLCTQRQPNSSFDLTEYDVVPSKEQHQMLTLVEKLCQSVNHGRKLANKIFICYRLSLSLDSSFQDLASERDYLSVFSRTVTKDCANKLRTVSDLITLADLSETELAKFLKDNIVAAVVEFHGTGLLIPTTLWDVNLDTEFHLIISLSENPSLLGYELLNASISLPSSEGVEVLIRSHDCYTSCCNVEGIGRVLRRARILASQALQAQKWHLLVRLLVGVGRYNDMSYIFQMLKDNDQFENLLRRGVHKAPGLHLAVSDFLQRHCPEDRELGKMVATHFGLHSKLAALWQAEADEIIAKLPIVDNILKDTSKTRQALNMAMDDYSHAAQRFLQAGKLNRALKISHRAQIVALQISLLGGPLVLKVQSHSQLQSLVVDSLSVAQSLLVARAYDMEPDWAAALHERWVLRGDKTFLADLKAANLLTPQLTQLYTLKYDAQEVTNYKAKDRLKQLTLPSVQQKSPLFKDLKRNW